MRKVILTFIFVISTLFVFSQITNNEIYKERFKKAINGESINDCKEFLLYYEYLDSAKQDVRTIKEKLINLYIKEAMSQKRQGNYISSTTILNNALRWCSTNKCNDKISRKIKTVNRASYKFNQLYNEIKLTPGFTYNLIFFDLYNDRMDNSTNESSQEGGFGGSLYAEDRIIFQKGNGSYNKYGVFFKIGAGFNRFKKGVRNADFKFGLVLTEAINPYFKYNLYDEYIATTDKDFEGIDLFHQKNKGNTVFGLELKVSPFATTNIFAYYEASSPFVSNTIISQTCMNQKDDCIENIDVKTNTTYKSYGFGVYFLDNGPTQGSVKFIINSYDVSSFETNEHLYSATSLFIVLRVEFVIGRQYFK